MTINVQHIASSEENGQLRTSDAVSPVRLLLVGGGHAHVEVIRQLSRFSGGNLETTLLSPAAKTPYSGMLPGFVSGAYDFDEFHIDLAKLCARSKVSFVRDEAIGIELASGKVHRSQGPALGFDLLSLNVGSSPKLPRAGIAGIAAKPISDFSSQVSALYERIRTSEGAFRLAVVGTGPAGVELAFALRSRVETLLGAKRNDEVEVVLVGRSDVLLPERNRVTRRLVSDALAQRGIKLLNAFDARDFRDGELVDGNGRRLTFDEVVWATSSAAPTWLRRTGLALDAKGFVRVDEMLRSVSHPNVFAAGDVASLADPRPKSGVFAVREGPVLAENLIRAAAGRTLHRYRPQRHWLAIISTADGKAVADKWSFAVRGRWVLQWKEWNDRRFVDRYGDAGSTWRSS